MSPAGKFRTFTTKLRQKTRSAFIGPGGLRFGVVLLVATAVGLVATAGALEATGTPVLGPLAGFFPFGSGTSFKVVASPSNFEQDTPTTLTATISHSIPSVTWHVTFTVKEPNGNTGSCTLPLKTGPKGSGSVSVTYPFSPTAKHPCPAPVGTSSTHPIGKYHVTASFFYVYPIATAKTTFTTTD